MKQLAAFSLALFATCLAAQTPLPPACGPDGTNFKVKTETGAPIPGPQPGAATVVFLQDQIEVRPGQPPCPLCTSQVRFGLDGQWVAATRGFSHFAVSVPAGEHHFCALRSPDLNGAPLPALYALTLEAGRTYYLRARLLYPYKGFSGVDLTEPNLDEARYLVSVSKQSTFTPK